MALLDRETRGLHAEADRGWHRLLRGGANRDDYAHQLTVTYGFEVPFEAACSYTPGLGQLIDLRGRARANLIAQDLFALGCALDGVKAIPCYALAPFRDPAEALAWMYVVERPTLIYAQVCEELTTRFLDLGHATTYLNAFETTASKRRSELGIALDLLCVSDPIHKRVTEAAHAGFHALIEWHRMNVSMLQSVG